MSLGHSRLDRSVPQIAAIFAGAYLCWRMPKPVISIRLLHAHDLPAPLAIQSQAYPLFLWKMRAPSQAGWML